MIIPVFNIIIKIASPVNVKNVPKTTPKSKSNPIITFVNTFSPPMKYKSLYKTIIILSIIGLIFPSLSFAQDKTFDPPKTIDEAIEIGEQVGKKSIEELPGTLKKTWRTDVLPIWQKMWDWTEGVWNSYLGQKVDNLWLEIKYMFNKEIEQRKPEIEKEFQKEKQELKEELPIVGKSIWERFKELIE